MAEKVGLRTRAAPPWRCLDPMVNFPQSTVRPFFCCLLLAAFPLRWNMPVACAAEPALTLAEARALALRTHPRITASDLRAQAARAGVRVAESANFPTLAANFTATGSSEQVNTRIGAAGSLSVSQVFDHAAIGLNATHLLTDFGRTASQIEVARQKSHAEDSFVRTYERQVELQVTAAYFATLQAQSVLSVARQTVTTRTLALQQVSALASNQLKSELDVSFARVNVEEARLLVARAESELESGFTELSLHLGERTPRHYALAEEPLPGELSEPAETFVAQALRERPRLVRLRAEAAAAAAQARADRAVNYPTVSALGSVGLMPVRDRRLEDRYAAGGIVVNLPLFNGGHDTAKLRESELKAQAAEALVRDEENNIIRDVRLALLKVQHTRARLELTANLLAHARTSHDLAAARYKLGASSITELSQAQLNLTSAEINEASAKYDYLLQRAVLDFHRGAH